MNQAIISRSLFTLVALWCVLVGLSYQTVTGTADFAWLADALAGADLSRFDPIMAQWAHWTGLSLMTAGIVLLLLTRVLFASTPVLLAATLLASGTTGAQVYSSLSLGASGPLLMAGFVFFLCSLVAAALGFLHLESQQKRQ